MADIVYYINGSSLMHWRPKGSKNGERNYQNQDGTYTELGKERKNAWYASKKKASAADIYRNSKAAKDEKLKNMTTEEIRADVNKAKAKKAYNEMWDAAHPDPTKKTYENIDNVTKAVQNINNEAIKNVDKYIRNNMITVNNSDVDVKSLSDKELSDRINRIRNEKAYAELTTTKVADEGAVKVRDILETVGSLVAIAAGGVAIVKTINEMKKK